jgi:hypothetical protein
VLFLRDPRAELLLERGRAEKEAAELLLCGLQRKVEAYKGRGRRS